MDGILCLDKSAGMSSFACCAMVRRLCGEKKVGHAGTLDPMATGVLPLMLGRATRAIPLLPDHDKRYTATWRFGWTSDTLDVWGKAVKTEAPLPSRAAVEAVLPSFVGEIMQVPPMVSALKKDGVRLYELARQGVEIPREARSITVYELNLLDFDAENGEITVDCRCSSGTYIRSLCDDLGRMLGCGAMMTALRRTQAAGFSLSDCVTEEQLKNGGAEEIASRLLPTDHPLRDYPSVTVTAAQATRFSNGGALALDRLNKVITDTARVYAPQGEFLGLGRPENGELRVLRLL